MPVLKLHSSFFGEHPKQDKLLTCEERWQVVAAGRRFGKGNFALRKAAKIGALHPGCRIWIVSPTYSFTDPMWDKAVAAFSQMRVGASSFVQKTRIKDRDIVLFNGAEIQFKTSVEPDSLRGAGDLMEFLIVDEAAYCEEEAWKAVRPALMDHKAPAVFISTPNRLNPKNWFYDLWLKGQTHLSVVCPGCGGGGQCSLCCDSGSVLIENPAKTEGYASWQFSSYDNPYIDPAEIDDLIATSNWNSQDVRREIFAEFLGGTAVIFPYEAVRDCIKGQFEAYTPGCMYVIGVDLGRVESHTVVTVLRFPASDQEVPHVVRIERFQGSWGVQKQRIADIAKHYASPPAFIDATGLGDPLRHELELEPYNVRKLNPVKFSGTSKPQIVDALVGAVNGSSISFPEHAQLEKELVGLEAKTTPGGTTTYQRSKGVPDDCVMSLCLAYWGFLTLGGGTKRGGLWIRGIGR